MNALDIAVVQMDSHARMARDVAALPQDQQFAAQMQLRMMSGFGASGDFDETLRVLRRAGLRPTPGVPTTAPPAVVPALPHALPLEALAVGLLREALAAELLRAPLAAGLLRAATAAGLLRAAVAAGLLRAAVAAGLPLAPHPHRFRHYCR